MGLGVSRIRVGFRVPGSRLTIAFHRPKPQNPAVTLEMDPKP